jgi:hypothetical protein
MRAVLVDTGDIRASVFRIGRSPNVDLPAAVAILLDEFITRRYPGTGGAGLTESADRSRRSRRQALC